MSSRRLVVTLGLCAMFAWACANGLIAEPDGGVDDASLGDAQTAPDAPHDVVQPGDAGCPATTKPCGSVCADLQNDPQHCGGCTVVCSAPEGGTAVCAAGLCDFACGDGGLAKCASACVNEQTDPQNCGGCGAPCDGGLCNAGSCCPPGDVICGGQCTDTTSDNANCGSCGKACDGGTCVASQCQTSAPYKVGNYTAFTSASSHSPNFLLGSRITLTKSAKLIDFGLISKSSGANVVMALYTESGGHPGTLVAYTSQVALNNSDQLLTPNTQANLSAANYWIMAVYNTNASVGFDTSNPSVEVDYISFTFGGTLPATFPTPITYTGQQFNYYLVVQ